MGLSLSVLGTGEAASVRGEVSISQALTFLSSLPLAHLNLLLNKGNWKNRYNTVLNQATPTQRKDLRQALQRINLLVERVQMARKVGAPEDETGAPSVMLVASEVVSGMRAGW